LKEGSFHQAMDYIGLIKIDLMHCSHTTTALTIIRLKFKPDLVKNVWQTLIVIYASWFRAHTGRNLVQVRVRPDLYTPDEPDATDPNRSFLAPRTCCIPRQEMSRELVTQFADIKRLFLKTSKPNVDVNTS
jgi:hypothetical protein